MNSETQIIAFLQEIDYQSLDVQTISKRLLKEGFKNARNAPFSTAQINSLIHSANQAKRKASYKRVESCGIDREQNPCGDASDY